MVDSAPQSPGLSVNDIQTRLAADLERWMTDRDGRLGVQLLELATVVLEIAQDIAARLVDHHIASRYSDLAAAMRRNVTEMPPEAAQALNRWADGIDRQAATLRSHPQTQDNPQPGGDKR
jgi:hypothetical protein